MAKTVYVGMSGGVDSSVTAALLKNQGYNLVGVFMKNWTKDVLGFKCPWKDDLNDAQSVAAKLAIPFKIFDFQNQYKQKVVDYMINEYKAGVTPNPDIMCNQEIKFKLFLETALADGADLIATGHYARIAKLQGRYFQTGIYQAKDLSKDQSYFLYRVTRGALKKSLMPIGELKKTEVRKLAKRFGLPTANKPDSQGICFVGEVPVQDFLKQYIKSKTGPIKTLDGKTIGEHDGAVFYTIGQRHGLDIGGGRPYYVVNKDIKTNTVFVTNDPTDDELYKSNFMLSEPSWINEPPEVGKTYQVRSRYRGRLIDGQLSSIRHSERSEESQDPSANAQGDNWIVKLNEPERAITPGQSAVVYDRGLVLGGGIIALT